MRRQPPVSLTTSWPPSLFAESLPSRRSLPFTEATLISAKGPLFLATPWICHRPGVGAGGGPWRRLGFGPCAVLS